VLDHLYDGIVALQTLRPNVHDLVENCETLDQLLRKVQKATDGGRRAIPGRPPGG
jgi:hypothetical protein